MSEEIINKIIPIKKKEIISDLTISVIVGVLIGFQLIYPIFYYSIKFGLVNGIFGVFIYIFGRVISNKKYKEVI